MSRCFPFDPSKYERKTTTEEPDLLKKEKHREKKHKKEKRDKEKKEKREKDRSDEKHKEKKDKKDKHKDKKKDKEKHRDKDKHKTDSSLPDEKRPVGLPGPPQIPVPSEKSKDNRTNDRSSAPMVEKRVAPGLAASQNGEVVGRNSHLGSEAKGSKYPPEMGWRSPDEEKRPNFQMPDKNLNMERKKDGLFKLSGKSPGPKERASFDGRMEERAVPGEPRLSGNARVPPNSVGMAQNRVGGPGRPMVVERKMDLRMEGKEKSREREGDDGKVEKSREKEKRKEEKVKATSEQKHIELSRMMEPGSKNQLPKPVVKDGSKKEYPSATLNSGLQSVPRNSSSNHGSGPVSSLGKRKDFGLNGSYDEHTSGPNKLARTTTTTTNSTVMENGRSTMMMVEPPSPATQQRPPLTVKVDPTSTLGPTTNHSQKPPMNVVKAEPTKDRKINGMITPSQSTSKADRKPDAIPPAIARGPHPDAKYLSQVLSVPKLDEWPSFDDDDQDWLFSSSRSQSKQQQNPEEAESSSSTPQVWAKALWLDPVDIHALPYVIPH